MAALETTLHAALDAVTPALPALLADLEPARSTTSELQDDALEQLLRAFVSVMHEGIDGGRRQRELVMATAVPALTAAGQTVSQLVRTQVAFFMAMQPLMLEAAPADQREAVSQWLAAYAAGYTGELLDAAGGS